MVLLNTLDSAAMDGLVSPDLFKWLSERVEQPDMKWLDERVEQRDMKVRRPLDPLQTPSRPPPDPL
eukprot:1175939-Prorocentrum_minimum.AAC.2